MTEENEQPKVTPEFVERTLKVKAEDVIEFINSVNVEPVHCPLCLSPKSFKVATANHEGIAYISMILNARHSQTSSWFFVIECEKCGLTFNISAEKVTKWLMSK